MKYIKSFSEIGQNEIEIVGGKAINLGRMTQKGLPVPWGFCITTNAYKKYVKANGIGAKIQELLKGLGSETIHSDTENEIAKLFYDNPIGEEIKGEIVQFYNGLKNRSVAVRSSATSEDLAYASFAGQQETFLNINGLDEVIIAVKKCWASLWSLRAIDYRNRNHIDHDKISIAVVIQELIDADFSGIAFTANPVSFKKDEIVINASWGLGEAIVSGLVTPDNIIVDKKSMKVTTQQISDKQLMTVSTLKGIIETPVPEEKRNISVLSEKNLKDLLELTSMVEALYNEPMDIEWASHNDNMYLLQARPITTPLEDFYEEDLMNMQWTREIVIERWIKPITPVSWSYMKETLFSGMGKCFDKLGLKYNKEIPFFKLFYGFVYINCTMINEAMKDMPVEPMIQMPNQNDAQNNTMAKAILKKPGIVIVLMKMLKFLNSTHKEWETLLNDFIKEFDSKKPVMYNELGLRELLDELKWNREVPSKLYDNHAGSILAADITIKILESFLKDSIGSVDKALIPTLLSGLTGNLTVKTNHELWEMSNMIQKDRALHETFVKMKNSDDWFSEIKEQKGNDEFVKRLESFLNQFGHRLPSYDIIDKPLRDQPGMIYEMLEMYLNHQVKDPMENEMVKTNEREKLTEEIAYKLPLLKRTAFKKILGLTQIYFRLRENQQFYLMKMIPNLRNVYMCLSKIFCEKAVLNELDDIFYLELDEMVAIASKLAGLPFEKDHHPENPSETVRLRRKYNERYENFSPDIVLGVEKVGKDINNSNKHIGIAASSGIVKGKARVILSNKEFNKLKKGEILVTVATTPTWTPLFGIAGGVVTEFGALLSHSAVVAREYGLPAVLGVENITSKIEDGDEITIDGSNGCVYIEKISAISA